MQCLDERRLKEYLSGDLPADELIAASEHVRACPVCRAKLVAARAYQKAACSVGEVTLAVGECPEYEDLSAYVDGELARDVGLGIERHINLCELCWQDVETLQEARSRASLAPPIVVTPGQFVRRRAWNVFGWRSAMATAVGAAAVAAMVFFSHTAPVVKTPGGPRIARNPIVASAPVVPDKPAAVTPNIAAPAPTVVKPAQPVHVATNVKPAPAPKPVFVAELRDGGITVGRTDGKLGVRSDGRDLEARVAALVEKKLRTGKVPPSFRIAMNTDVLRNQPADVSDIRKISPIPDSIVEPRPEFQWQPVDGAIAYRVEVYDLKGNPVVSAVTDDTIYQPGENLPGGGYRWMVWARRGALAEWEPSKAAIFRVLTQSEKRLISQARESHPGSHLVLGTVYESIGLNEDAVREFKTLAAENPKSPLAAKLLNGAKSKLHE